MQRPLPLGLVFDLDGTLVDSRLDLATAVNATRERLALPPLPVAEVTAMVGEGARTLVRRALPPDVEGDRFEAAFAAFLEVYWEVCLDKTQAYAGVREALGALAGRVPLAVLTNKPEGSSRRILEGLGLATYFETLVGGDTLPTRKPDPAGLWGIARRWRIDPARLMLVGDSRVDVETASAAGTALALVPWGYGSPDELAGVEARRVSSPRELVSLLD